MMREDWRCLVHIFANTSLLSWILHTCMRNEKLGSAKKLNVYEDSVDPSWILRVSLPKVATIWKANRILSALDVSLMSNDMRQYYYGLYGELYDALRQTAITSIQREYYERRRLLYRDFCSRT